MNMEPEAKHRGYGFVTFSNQADALDAIDNMDMNEFHGKVVKVNLAKPQKITGQGLGNRASKYNCPLIYT
jgi:peptidyl-prolyl isomerase E (cyclophilin E)